MQNAVIVWFDASSGEGEIQLENGQLMYLNYTAIKGIDTNNYIGPSILDQPILSDIAGRKCKVSLYTNVYTTMIEKLELI